MAASCGARSRSYTGFAPGNRTGDSAINEISVREQRAVISKDEDFFDMFLLRLDSILIAFETHDFVELDRSTLTCHS